jgi:hypothetical protein
VNNTPVVLVLIPIVVRLADRLQFAPTRLLIPLSYVSILGGACKGALEAIQAMAEANIDRYQLLPLEAS